MEQTRESTPITDLTVQQLQQLGKQLEQEIEYMQNSMQQLKLIQDKFSNSLEAVERIAEEKVPTKMMVPLTGSMYVLGTMDPQDKVMVDIGTGYYAEKSHVGAADFFKRKIDYLSKEIESVQPVFQEKYAQKQSIFEILQSKMRTGPPAAQQAVQA